MRIDPNSPAFPYSVPVELHGENGDGSRMIGTEVIGGLTVRQLLTALVFPTVTGSEPARRAALAEAEADALIAYWNRE